MNQRRLEMRIARLRKGLTQADLAKKSGIPLISISYFEQGRMNLSAERIQILSDLLGISTEAIRAVEE